MQRLRAPSVPVLATKAGHASEVLGVVGHENDLLRDRVCRANAKRQVVSRHGAPDAGERRIRIVARVKRDACYPAECRRQCGRWRARN